jgi:hypothetical protein
VADHDAAGRPLPASRIDTVTDALAAEHRAGFGGSEDASHVPTVAAAQWLGEWSIAACGDRACLVEPVEIWLSRALHREGTDASVAITA